VVGATGRRSGAAVIGFGRGEDSRRANNGISGLTPAHVIWNKQIKPAGCWRSAPDPSRREKVAPPQAGLRVGNPCAWGRWP
jgi:hypothetical protein